ncbi:MAG: hypothetical protein IH598_17270 [Bacteroidales bacterium]|nr:hypothetical protein [Bacteroidales bacterium]
MIKFAAIFTTNYLIVMAATPKLKLQLQPYPREGTSLLAANYLFPQKHPKLSDTVLESSIDNAFQRCLKNKKGELKTIDADPKTLVNQTLKHLKERSDPILSPYFLSLLDVEDIFELDAVSYEMQRHRMTIGIFYQFLILELMRNSWPVFDASREGDIVADIDTPGFERGIRLYISVKKSKDTVGGQDVGGVIRRLENEAKAEKNLNSPYLCVIGIATPPKGKLRGYDDRTVRSTSSGGTYSLNCEFWGPGFLFPFIAGHSALEIYTRSIRRVSNYLPFMTLAFKKECSFLLRQELSQMNLITADNKIDTQKFLNYIIE